MSSKIGASASICLLLLSLLVSISHGSEVKTENGEVKPSFKLPKFFEFSYFKQLFKRTYKSFSEELVRQKIYLGRAFRVFISAVHYECRKSSWYMAINEMSDWTNKEIKSMYMDPSVVLPDLIKDPGVRQTLDRSENVPMPRESNVQKVLQSQEANILNDEDFKDQNLDGPSLSLDDLIRDPTKTENETSELVPTVNTGSEASKLTFSGRSESQVEATSGLQDWENDINSSELMRQDDVLFIDHRTSGCFFTPRIQGPCGSCYAFATIALYEWFYCKATGVKEAFSEQYIIDCGNLVGLNGCSGGYPPLVGDFVRLHGLELLRHYPCIGKLNTCPYERGTPPDQMGYLRLQDSGHFQVNLNEIEEHLAKTPLVVIIYMNEEFVQYGGGVLDSAYFDKKGVTLHAALLVGSGRENGKDYWLFRNSFGVTWGEEGYFKLSKATEHLILAQNSIFEMRHFFVPFTDMTREASEQVKRRYEEVLLEFGWKQ